jgi:hypothetical protein
MMKNVLHPGVRACLIALGLVCAPALLAQPLPFAKRWLLDGAAAAPAAYTILTIDDARIGWSAPGASPPPCSQAFALRQERPGTVYLDGRGRKFVAGVQGSIPTYLLAIVGGDCRGIEDQLRISYPLVYDTDHIEVIEYVKGKPVSSRRFHRAPEPVTPARRGSTGGHRDPRSPGRP